MHVISFTRPSPELVLQATNAGVGRPGYEAITPVLKTVTGVTILCTVDIALAWLWPTGLFHILEKKEVMPMSQGHWKLAICLQVFFFREVVTL